MDIKDVLVFDHTYISIKQDQFSALQELSSYFTSCKIQQVRSGESMWEGIYFNTANLSYIELINEKFSKGRKGGLKGQIAIAIHSTDQEKMDVSRLLDNYPNLGWNVVHRLRTEQKTPWFDSYSNYGDSPNSIEFNPYFRSWAMNYHVNHPNERIEDMANGPERDRVLANDLIGIKEVEYEVANGFYEYIIAGTKWFPNVPSIANGIVSLVIPDRNGDNIKLTYIINEETERNKISKIIFYKNPNSDIEAKEVENDKFSIYNTKDMRIIEFNNK